MVEISLWQLILQYHFSYKDENIQYFSYCQWIFYPLLCLTATYFSITEHHCCPKTNRNTSVSHTVGLRDILYHFIILDIGTAAYLSQLCFCLMRYFSVFFLFLLLNPFLPLHTLTWLKWVSQLSLAPASCWFISHSTFYTSQFHSVSATLSLFFKELISSQLETLSLFVLSAWFRFIAWLLELDFVYPLSVLWYGLLCLHIGLGNLPLSLVYCFSAKMIF